MKEIKRGLLRIFFVLELCGFAFVYLFGAQGMQVLIQLRKENKRLEAEIQQLDLGVARLHDEVLEWQNDEFRKEKLAREQLQMARPGDEIYYVS